MSGEGKQVLNHTGILMGMELGIRVMDAVVSVILARYLMPEGFGLLAFGVSFGALYGILAGFGMGYLVTRDVASDSEAISNYLSNGLMAKVFLSVLTLTLMALNASLMGFSLHKIEIVLVAGLQMVMETNLGFALSVYQGLRKMWTVAIGNLIPRIGWLILSLAVVAMKGDVFALLWVRVLVNTVCMIGVLIMIHFSVAKIRLRFDWRAIVKMLKSSYPFALFRLRGTVYADLDTVMISWLANDQMTGWYASARKTLRIFTFIPTSFSTALIPTLSKTVKHSTKDAVWTLNQSCRYLWVLSMPIVAGVVPLAPQLVRTLYGPGYEEATGALQILILSVPFAFLNGSLLAGVSAVRKEKKGSNILIGGLLFSGLSNFIVVPLFGHLGAASTTVVSEIMILLLQARVVRQLLPGFKFADVKPGLWVASAAMAACAFGLSRFGWQLALIASCLVYVPLVFWLGVLTPKDVENLRGMFRRKPSAAVAAQSIQTEVEKTS